MKTTKLDSKLKKFALDSLKNSYSPYSKKKVGAAVLTSQGKIFTGSNIENASYGATVCAERVAIWKAISEKNVKLKKVFVAVEQKDPWPPCGMCRQVIAEFAAEDCQVICVSRSGKSIEFSFKDLLPASFNPKHLLVDAEK